MTHPYTTNSLARPGFTLIELLIVVGILAVLAGILFTVMTRARETAGAVAAQQFMGSIAAGLGAFEQDFNRFPPSEITNTASPMNGWNGAEIMAQLVLGPMPEAIDGVTGPGYKMSVSGVRSGEFSTTGPTHGPFIEIRGESTLFPRWDQNGDGSSVGEFYGSEAPARPDAYVFASPSSDSNAPLPILYYHKGSGTSGSLLDSDPIWGDGGMYDTNDNANLVVLTNTIATGTGTAEDVINYWATTEANGGPSDEDRQQLEYTLRAADFILVATGPDETFGTQDDILVTGP